MNRQIHPTETEAADRVDAARSAREVPLPVAVDHTQIRFRAPDGTTQSRALMPAGDATGMDLTSLVRGALIDTDQGPRRVEDLRIGDLVMTREGGPRPLRWIARRHLGLADLARSPKHRPIRIRAGALGPDMPRRDILLSPNSRTLLSDWRCHMLFGEEEMLAPVDALLNDLTITRDHDQREIEYFHIMLDRHAIISADGIEVETYHPGYFAPTTLAPDALAAIARRFPHLDGDLSRFGRVARPRLKAHEALVLLHQQTG